MFLAPAAWVRSSQVPECARDWPSAIGACFAGARGPVHDRVRALEQFAGARWVGWLLPEPSTWRTVAPRVVEVVRRVRAAGVVLNAEAEWKSDQPERYRANVQDARAMVQFFENEGIAVVLCTYALPPASFPLEGFNAAKAGIAETYDRDVRLDDGYVQQSRERWRARGWSAQWVPCVGLWNASTDRVKTDEELARHLAARPRDSVVWGPSVWPRRVCTALERWQSSDRGEPTQAVPTQAAIAAALFALFTWLFRRDG